MPPSVSMFTMPMDDQTEFFDPHKQKEKKPQTQVGHRPLAARMRPRTLEDLVGQKHIISDHCLLPRLLKSDSFGSIFLYGPPGCGKTTLAEVIANETNSKFVRVNAVSSNTAEIRDILRWARNRPEDRTILFIDEIHRFNKAQQDLLLPDVEEGSIRLIGATTHNPGHYVNAPLLSRSHLFRLEPIQAEEMASVLSRALTDTERGLGNHNVSAESNILLDLARFSDGDMRRALNSLETIALSVEMGGEINEQHIELYAKERQIRYDANEDEHYDTISAFIKSVRGSDPDAALYWLAKMIEGGEDPRFIARRLVILASEDIGLADSRGLTLAVSAQQAVEFVGMPECQYALAHASMFLAMAPKSNSIGTAYFSAKASLKNNSVQTIPLHLRDAHTKTNKSMGHGKDYKYSHDFPENISGQEFMPDPQTFYQPKINGAEKAIGERLQHWKNLKRIIQSKENS